MRCVNCQQEINVGGFVCPFCHFHPARIGDGPYDGGPNSKPMFGGGYSGPGLLRVLFCSLFPGKGYTVIQEDNCEGGWLTKWRCSRCTWNNSPKGDHCLHCGNQFKK